MNILQSTLPGRTCTAFAAVLLLMLFATDPSFAASPAIAAAATASAPQSGPSPLDQDLSPAEREALLARLSDEQVRGLVLEMLERNAAAAATEAPQADPLLGVAQAMRVGFGTAWTAAPEIASLPGAIYRGLAPEGAPTVRPLVVVFGIVAVVLFGLLCEYGYLRATGTSRARLERQALSLPPIRRVEPLFARYLIRLAGVAVLAAGAFVAFVVLHRGFEPIRILMMTALEAVVMFRLLQVTARALLEPQRSDLRNIALDDADALLVYKRLVWIGLFFLIETILSQLLRIGGASDEALMFHLVVILSLWLVLMVTFTWQVRKPIGKLILGSSDEAPSSGSAIALLARAWHIPYLLAYALLTVSILYARFSGTWNPGAGLTTLMVLLTLPVLLALIGSLIRCRAADGAHDPDAEPEADKSQSGLVDVLVRGVRIALILAAVLFVAGEWGVDFASLSEHTLGGKLVGAAVEILVAVFLAYLVWAVIRRVMDPYMPDSEATGPGDEGGGTGASRISTLMPIARKVLFITLVTVTIMVIISAMGVNIGPLLAGAGVVGLAIGFGAQTLVKDIISGAFFLMDDAFRQGEYLDIGSVKGTVERISVRSLQLRHHNGPVHTVPYGEIQHVTNFSRDWAIMKFELRIPFETDLEKVRKLIKKVGIAMMDDPVFGPLLMEPIKSQGVNRMDDSALIIRCKFTAIPGQQFYVRREAFRKIQEAFEANGIKFAPRRVIVESSPGTPDSAVAAAAASADTPPPAAPADDRG